jgi:hypothetical protein
MYIVYNIWIIYGTIYDFFLLHICDDRNHLHASRTYVLSRYELQRLYEVRLFFGVFNAPHVINLHQVYITFILIVIVFNHSDVSLELHLSIACFNRVATLN